MKNSTWKPTDLETISKKDQAERNSDSTSKRKERSGNNMDPERTDGTITPHVYPSDQSWIHPEEDRFASSLVSDACIVFKQRLRYKPQKHELILKHGSTNATIHIVKLDIPISFLKLKTLEL
ncbi:unnamed protein product [Caretta caretta]